MPKGAWRAAVTVALLAAAAAGLGLLLRSPEGGAARTDEGTDRGASPDAAGGPSLSGIARPGPERTQATAAAGTMAATPEEAPVPRQPRIPDARRIHGLLLDADGTPAVTGRVVSVAREPPASGWPGDRHEARASDAGRFELDVPLGERVHLVAWSQTAAPTAFECQVEADGDVGALRLAPGAVLQGSLVAAPGSKLVKEALLRATRVGASESAWFWRVSQVERVATLENGRCASLWIETKTDHAGRWRIQGLTPGPYVVEALEVGLFTRLHDGARASTQVTATAPASGVELPLPCAIVELKPPPPTPPEVNALPLQATLTDEAGASTRLRDVTFPDWEGTTVHRMAVRPGELYQVRLQAHGYHAKVIEVRAPPAGEELAVPVSLERTGRGTLRLLPPEGREGGDGRVWLELHEAASGEYAARYGVDLGPGRSPGIVMPEGRWTLEIEPGEPLNARAADWDLPEPPVGIEIHTDRETLHRRRPPQGGRFALEVTRKDGGSTEFDLRLRRADGPFDYVGLAWTSEGQGKSGGSVGLAPGRLYTALTPWPPGDVELEVFAPDCAPVRLPVRLEPGRTTTVKALLVPR